MSIPSTASVVIIGGGVVGCSIAYHLARRGLRDVVVLERDTVGSGTTSKAAGGIRAQFPTETEVRFSLEAIRVFERFHEEFGVDIGYRKIGYLFLISDEDDLRGFEERMALQRSLGVDVRLITPKDAQALVPALRVDDLVAAVWGPQTAWPDRRRSPTASPDGPASWGRASWKASTSPGSTSRAGACAAFARTRSHRGAARGQCGGPVRGPRRAPGRPCDCRASAPAPHLLHGAVSGAARTGAPHHRSREWLLLPQGDGAGAAQPGRRRGRRRRSQRRRRLEQGRDDGSDGAASHPRHRERPHRRGWPACGPSPPTTTRSSAPRRVSRACSSPSASAATASSTRRPPAATWRSGCWTADPRWTSRCSTPSASRGAGPGARQGARCGIGLPWTSE